MGSAKENRPYIFCLGGCGSRTQWGRCRSCAALHRAKRNRKPHVPLRHLQTTFGKEAKPSACPGSYWVDTQKMPREIASLVFAERARQTKGREKIAPEAV
jgi:hypothetical protein